MPVNPEYQPPYAPLPRYSDPSPYAAQPDYGMSYQPPWSTQVQPETPAPVGMTGPTASPTAPTAAPAAPSNYGPYLGWDQGKLNDPQHNTPKYQFLRAMLDAGVSSQNRDKAGALAALKARGYPVEDVLGSDDRIRWGGQEFDIFNGTNGDFLFGDPYGGQQSGAMPQPGGVMSQLPAGSMEAYGGGMSGQPNQQSLGGLLNTTSYGTAPSLGSRMANPQPGQPAVTTPSRASNPDPGSNFFSRYAPPYMGGA